jgi:hypothetical protein
VLKTSIVKHNDVVSRKSADSGHSNFHIERGPNGERILRSGPAAKSNRDELSNQTEFRNNANALLKKEYGDKVPPGMQTHHKVSVNSVRNGSSDLAKLLLERAKQGYKIDRDSNLKTMPGGPKAIDGGAKDPLLHRSQHPNWDKHVDEAMRRAGEAAKTQFCVENLKDLSNAQLDEVMRNVEDTLEQDLVRVNSDINKLKPGEAPGKGTQLQKAIDEGNWIKPDHIIDGKPYYRLSLDNSNSLQNA